MKIIQFVLVFSLCLLAATPVTIKYDTIEAIVEANGGLAVNIQDQHTEIVNVYLYKDFDTLEISQNAFIGDKIIHVVEADSVIVGYMICLRENLKFFQAQVIAVDTVGDSITLDSPLDYAYDTSAIIYNTTHDLNVDGSTIAQTFKVTPPAGVQWDITRIKFHLEDSTAMDDGTFGGDAALTNGFVLRMVNGSYKNIFNAKTNGDIALFCNERTYATKPPAGTGHAMNATRVFAGQQNNGVTVRLDGDSGDELEIIIQDDLTILKVFHVIVSGHVVQ